MTQRLFNRETAARRSARHRTALLGLLGVLGWTLTGCGDPDDDDGGGGYVAQQPIGQAERP